METDPEPDSKLWLRLYEKKAGALLPTSTHTFTVKAVEVDSGDDIDQIGQILGDFRGRLLLGLVPLVILLITIVVINVILLLGTRRQALGLHENLK